MSANVVPDETHPQGHRTVAELVAREQAVTGTGSGRAGRAPGANATTRELHVSELLRREGFDAGVPTEGADIGDLRDHEELRDGRDTEVTAPAVLTAPPRERERSGSRGPWVGKAAVLFGLTVGGLIGLQSTVTTSPAEPTGPQPRGVPLAGAAEHSSSPARTGTESTSTSRGAAATTTSPKVRLQSNSVPLDRQNERENQAEAATVVRGDQSGEVAAPSEESEAVRPSDTERHSDPTTALESQSVEQTHRRTGTTERQTAEMHHQVRQSGETSTKKATTSTNTPTESPSQESESPSPESSPSEKDDDAPDSLTGTLTGVLDEVTDLLGL